MMRLPFFLAPLPPGNLFDYNLFFGSLLALQRYFPAQAPAGSSNSSKVTSTIRQLKIGFIGPLLLPDIFPEPGLGSNRQTCSSCYLSAQSGLRICLKRAR